MKLNKILISLILISGMAAQSFAAQSSINTPKSDRGAEIDSLYGGYKSTYIVDASETVICSGRCLLANIIMATGAVSAFITVRDTSVANATGKLLIPNVRFNPVATAVNGAILRPIRSTMGISVQLSTTPNALEGVTVVYLDGI